MPIDLARKEPRVGHRPEPATLHARNHTAQNSGHDRLALLNSGPGSARPLVDGLLSIAVRGLPRMYNGDMFAHTLRSIDTRGAGTERLEGVSIRYTAMTALGMAHLDSQTQMRILGGSTVMEMLDRAAAMAQQSQDAGSAALVAWATAEVSGVFAAPLFQALAARFQAGTPISTVECAWTLSAALAAAHLGDTSQLRIAARSRLLSARAGSPLFGHMIPASASGLLRSHIGCFADQVYPIQALARLHVATGDTEALAAAEACARCICELQGSSGQWWWHYDIRNGSVAEGYPVYSVHQHAMAPMALLELREAGGPDLMKPLVSGLRWLEDHPEAPDPLIVPNKGVVWRKIARREPNKLVRKMAAASSALLPGMRLPGLEILFPATRIDRECRPYEFGLMLYAWLSGGTVASLAGGAGGAKS